MGVRWVGAGAERLPWLTLAAGSVACSDRQRWVVASIESVLGLATVFDPHPVVRPALLGLVLAGAPSVEAAWAFALAAVGLVMVAVVGAYLVPRGYRGAQAAVRSAGLRLRVAR
ncbi:MAG: hypothetical protein EXR71_11170 [Myxococcales bacterium]|nr:hypothetical protein [Myxococcales bacterium]